MNTLEQAISFGESLAETYCIVSRFRVPDGVERPPNYFTLHQIAYKVLRKNTASRELHNRLAGEDMMTHVRKAFLDVFHREPSLTEAERYYHRLRGHKNGQATLLEDPFGRKILARYQASLSAGLDWDDSLQTARWTIDNRNIQDLYKFPYKNIILIDPEALLNPKRTSALDFFISWHIWMEHYTKRNTYIITSNGHVSEFDDSLICRHVQAEK